MSAEHVRTLERFISLGGRLDELVADLHGFAAFDHERPLASLRKQHVIHVLELFLAAELGADDVERWADALEVREDVECEEVAWWVLHELSTPELYGPLTVDEAVEWIRKLRA